MGALRWERNHELDRSLQHHGSVTRQIHEQGWVCPRVFSDPTCRHTVNRMGKRRSLCAGLGGDHTRHMTFPGDEGPWGSTEMGKRLD